MSKEEPIDLSVNNKLYDFLKWLVLVALPAIGTLYFALAGIWGLPYAEEVLGTLVALELALGTLLGVSNHSYKKLEKDIDGEIGVDWSSQDLYGNLTGLELDHEMNPHQRTVKLKVRDDSQ